MRRKLLLATGALALVAALPGCGGNGPEPPSASGPPVIVAQSQGIKSFANEQVGLLVQAVGQEPLAYQWRRNGVPIAEANAPTHAIVQLDPARDDGTVLDVVVSNALGSVVSRPITLSVAPNTSAAAVSSLMQLANIGRLLVAASAGAPARHASAAQSAPAATHCARGGTMSWRLEEVLPSDRRVLFDFDGCRTEENAFRGRAALSLRPSATVAMSAYRGETSDLDVQLGLDYDLYMAGIANGAFDIDVLERTAGDRTYEVERYTPLAGATVRSRNGKVARFLSGSFESWSPASPAPFDELVVEIAGAVYTFSGVGDTLRISRDGRVIGAVRMTYGDAEDGVVYAPFDVF